VRGSQYPFADVATMTNGVDVIPDTLFSDLILHPVGGDDGLYLSEVSLRDVSVTLTFASPSGPVCSAAFRRGSYPSQLQLTDAFGRPAGLAVLNTIAAAALCYWSLGEHRFTPEEAAICPDVVLPMPEVGVRGFLLESGEILSGSVTFVAEDGVYFQSIDAEFGGAAYTQVRLDAMGDPLYLRRNAEDNEAVVDDGPFLQTINQQPGSNGHMLIYSGDELHEDSVVRITSGTYGLMIKLIGTK